MAIEIPVLDDRSAEQLFTEAKARIPVHTPEWTNFNDSDPGITVVQLFSFMSENLLYRSNRIPEASRRKFLTLLGIGLQPASPGRGLVAFRNERGPVQPWPLDAGVELRAGKTPFRTRTGVCILPVTASVFYKKPRTDLDDATKLQYQLLYDTFRETDTDQLQFYQTMPLEAPQIGKPLPVVDLADSVQGVIDRSLWVALVGPENVPVDSVRAAIAGQTLALGIYPSAESSGRTLSPESYESEQVADPGLVFEIAAPEPDQTGKFGVGPARYERLTVEYAENVLEQPGIVQVTLPAYPKLLLWDYDPEEEGTGDYPPLVEDKELAKRVAIWIRVRLPKSQDQSQNGAAAQASQKARLSWVGTNAARVIQALPVVNERLGVGTGTPDQIYKVANVPLILQAPDPLTASSSTTTSSSNFILEIQNADNGWDTWQHTDDLFAAKPGDRVYTVDPESGEVKFGSGLRGMRPPLGRTIRVSYEYGGGPAGAVAIGAINKAAILPGGFKVENPVSTWGANEGEDVAAGERNISRYLKHRDRAVTAGDFRDIVLRTPDVDVGRVEVLPLFNPDQFDPNSPPQTWPGMLTILVIPKYDPVQPDAPVPDRLFINAVCAWVDPRRLLTTEIHVRGPEYVQLWVSVGVVTRAGQMREIVHRNVQAAIRDYLSPLIGGPPVTDASSLTLENGAAAGETNGVCAEPKGVGWPLSTEVRRQDLEAVATRVAGVRYVEAVRLAIIGDDGATQTDTERVPIAGLQLPRLAGISVREGEAEDPANLLGQQPTETVNQVPVPVLPQTC